MTNQGSNTVSVIDTATDTVTSTVPVGSQPLGITVNPAGTKVYVANGESSDVSVIDMATNTVTATAPVGSSPNGAAIIPDGTKLYVTNLGNNTVSVINTATNTVTSTVSAGNLPNGVAVTPDGTNVYVANSDSNSNDVSVIDTATNTVTATVPVGQFPAALGNFIVSIPAPQPVPPVANFSSNVTSGYSPLTVKFTDLSVGATEWSWDFGDKTYSTDQNPVHSVNTENIQSA